MSGARGAFRVAMAALDRTGAGGIWATACRIGAALLLNFWPATLLLSVAVAAIGFAVAEGSVHVGCADKAGRWACEAAWGMASAVATVLVLIGAIVSVLAWAVFVTVRALRANFWGLCSGMSATTATATTADNTADTTADTSALTPTLHLFFQALAHLPPDQPLTFGHLWRHAPAPAGANLQRPAGRFIDLQIVTTAVNLARPVRLPGEPGADPLRAFFYDPQEWVRLFPAEIMAHLAAFARQVTLPHDDGRVLRALPAPEHWPVLLAARLSLSFPVLLSAVPMYIAVPRRARLRAGGSGPPLPFEARKVFFSDGGITSNCPIHLFDAPLPAFPTFGVNLYALPRGARARVSRSDLRDPELEAAATPDAAEWATPLPLLLGIVDTALNWRDSLQRSLPGYRERIVHIGLPPEAGGLNLAMTPRTIRRLDRLGRVAAEKLQRAFSTPRRIGEANAWERHRWTRARSTLSALHGYLQTFADRLVRGEPDYRRLLSGAAPHDPPFVDDGARRQAVRLLDGTQALVQAIDAVVPADAMDQNTPQPRPELHISPPW